MNRIKFYHKLIAGLFKMLEVRRKSHTLKARVLSTIYFLNSLLMAKNGIFEAWLLNKNMWFLKIKFRDFDFSLHS